MYILKLIFVEFVCEAYYLPERRFIVRFLKLFSILESDKFKIVIYKTSYDLICKPVTRYSN